MLFFTRFYPRFFSSALLFIRAISHPRDFSSAHFIRASFIRASSFAHLHPRIFIRELLPPANLAPAAPPTGGSGKIAAMPGGC
jgi:hypothetical protein